MVGGGGEDVPSGIVTVESLRWYIYILFFSISTRTGRNLFWLLYSIVKLRLSHVNSVLDPDTKHNRYYQNYNPAEMIIYLDCRCAEAHEAREEALVQLAVLLERHGFHHRGKLVVVPDQDHAL